MAPSWISQPILRASYALTKFISTVNINILRLLFRVCASLLDSLNPERPTRPPAASQSPCVCASPPRSSHTVRCNHLRCALQICSTGHHSHIAWRKGSVRQRTPPTRTSQLERRQVADNMSHHYIVSAQKPTAVTACITGNFTKKHLTPVAQHSIRRFFDVCLEVKSLCCGFVCVCMRVYICLCVCVDVVCAGPIVKAEFCAWMRACTRSRTATVFFLG